MCITQKVCRLSSLSRCFICENLRNLRTTAFSRFNDSLGVKMEGDTHGFRVVLVRPDDKLWTQQVLDAVTHVQKLHELRSGRRPLHLAPSLPLIR